jgi:signal transduction histidine kinase
MEQALGNLVTNACQAMPNGGRLTISAREQKGGVDIVVKDSGVGISPENMPKLFEPLFTTRVTGIGLGLAICRKLIEANEGRIEVESEMGKGSTFRVYLPIHQEEAQK